MSLALTAVAAAAAGLVISVPLRKLARLCLRRPDKIGRRAVALASLATSGGFALAVATTDGTPVLPLLLLVAGGTVLGIVDIQEKRLPNVALLATGLLVAVGLGTAAARDGEVGRLPFALAGAAGAFLIYFLLAVISPSGIGMGDVKLAAVLGLTTGYLGWTAWLTALVGGFFVGALVSLVALALRRADRRTLIPFGPSMLVGALLAIAFA